MRCARQAVDDPCEAFDRALQRLADLDRAADGGEDRNHLVGLGDDLGCALVDEARFGQHVLAHGGEAVPEGDQLGAALVDRPAQREDRLGPAVERLAQLEDPRRAGVDALAQLQHLAGPAVEALEEADGSWNRPRDLGHGVEVAHDALAEPDRDLDGGEERVHPLTLSEVMPPQSPSVSVVVVTYRQGEEVRPALEALAGQLRADDELIVIDNASGDGTIEAVEAAAPRARVVPSPENEGFPAACNRGAARALGDLLVFLNPDAVVAAGWREAIAAPLTDGSDWDAWQALVTAEEARIVNTRGGVVHFTGIAWAGGAGEPVSENHGTPPSSEEVPRELGGPSSGEPGFVSGACLAIRRTEFERLGGFAADFFLYHEDVDLSLRLRLAGGRLGVAVDARADHRYDFDKGPAKWRHLERNRWATLIRAYPAPLLALLAPALLATELALVVIAAVGGWLPQKLAAWGDVGRSLRRLLRERREIQSTAEISAADFAATLTASLTSAYLGRAGRSGLLNGLLGAYWRLVLRVLRLGRPA